MSDELDLGYDHKARFFGWSPDRDLNPQYEGIADEPKAGITITHLKPDGSECAGALTFDTPSMRFVRPHGPLWQVESYDPLTISPSVLCECGDHGLIRDGKWVPA